MTGLVTITTINACPVVLARRSRQTARMLGRTNRHWWGVVIDAPEPLALARFYADLMDWRIVKNDPDFVGIAPMGDHVEYFAFQRSPEYVPPVWPPQDG